MSRPGFRYRCSIVRETPSDRDDETLRPTTTPNTLANNVPCAAGLIDAAAVPQGTHGALTENVTVGCHVALDVDVRQGDIVTLIGSPWDADYRVADVRVLAIQQRLLLERNRGA
jgi:hypothetical protein